PDILIDAMQTGDRLGYHPELAQKEIAHFHEILPQAQAAVSKLVENGQKRLDELAQRASQHNTGQLDIQAEKQKRVEAFARAGKLATDAGK
ncbi:MAG TPA: hypothetical protein VK716_05885, partial [Terracidiphilus sp.]|nr:hypothetical protein [Terracidiphilus sp.]